MSCTRNTIAGNPRAGRGGGFLSLEPYSPPSWWLRGYNRRHGSSPPPTHRFNLAQTPTPVHRWLVPGLPDGCELFVKRDDLTGAQLSGNKVRKLEFLLADAVAKGADSVITIGVGWGGDAARSCGDPQVENICYLVPILSAQTSVNAARSRRFR